MTPSPSVPSVERKTQVRALWPGGFVFPSTLDRQTFWGLIAALDAQADARVADLKGKLDAALDIVRSTQAMAKEIEDGARAEVETMRERAVNAARAVKDSCERNATIHRPPYAAPNEYIATLHENGAAIAQQIVELIGALPIEGGGR